MLRYPRLVDETKQFDYRNVKQFEKHRNEMEKSGWICDEHYDFDNNGETYHTAKYHRGVLYNGVAGNGKYWRG